MTEKPDSPAIGHITQSIQSEALRTEMAALIAAVELSDITLLGCNAHRGTAPDLAGGESELATTIQHRVQFVEAGRVILCGVRFRIGPPNATPEAPVLQISAEYALVYRVAGTLIPGDDILRLFAARNAVPHAWPFFREMVSSLTGKMGLPSATLPVLKCFPEAPKPVAAMDESTPRLAAKEDVVGATGHNSVD